MDFVLAMVGRPGYRSLEEDCCMVTDITMALEEVIFRVERLLFPKHRKSGWTM